MKLLSFLKTDTSELKDENVNAFNKLDFIKNMDMVIEPHHDTGEYVCIVWGFECIEFEGYNNIETAIIYSIGELFVNKKRDKAKKLAKFITDCNYKYSDLEV